MEKQNGNSGSNLPVSLHPCISPISLVLAGVALAWLSGCGSSGSSAAPAPTLSPSATAMPTPSPTASAIPLSMLIPPTTTDPLLPKWFQILYSPTVTSKTPMVLNVQGASLDGGTAAILWPLQAGAQNELWEFTKSGQFISGLGDYPYNTFTSTNNPAQALVLSSSGSSAVTNPSQAVSNEGGGDKFQLWNTTANFCLDGFCAGIKNQLSGNYLYTSGTQDSQVTLVPAAQYQWAFWPPRTLQPILDASPVEYPSFTGDELTAYNYISQSLGLSGDSCIYGGNMQALTGLRCEYRNTAAPLSGYQTTMATLQQPSGVSASDWAATKLQLNTELTDAEAVQNLYNQYITLYNSLFINNEALLNQMISDAQITAPDSTMVSGTTVAIIEGVLYTAIEASAGLATGGLSIGIGAVGNIMETGINAAVASGTVSENPFHQAVSALWTQLSGDFTSIMDASADNETSILEDWGKLQQVATLISSTGPDSLALPPGVIPQLVTAMEPGFEVAAMQMLLPAIYSIFPAPQTNLDPSSGFYIFDQWTGTPPSWAEFVESMGNGVWNYTVLVDSSFNFPGQAAMQTDVFNNGVAPVQLFNNLSGPPSFFPQGTSNAGPGWNFPMVWRNVNTGGDFLAATGCNQLIVSITNQTPDNLTLHLTEQHGNLIGNTPRSLPAYATDVVGFAGDAGHGPDFTFGVDGPNGSSQFEVQQDHCVLEAGNITYSNQGNNGYSSTDLGSTTGSYSDDIPGIDRIAVYNPSANQ